MVSSIRRRTSLAPIVTLGIVIVLFSLAATRSQSAAPAEAIDALRPVVLTSVVDIPVAPDHAFLPVVGQSATTDTQDAVAAARKLAPAGYVGSKTVVRLLMVKEGRGDYVPQVIVMSADAAPITMFGDGASDRSPVPIIATYGWVFLTPTGEFIGATRQGFTSEAPPVPEE
jgi:hypothetical protein